MQNLDVVLKTLWSALKFLSLGRGEGAHDGRGYPQRETEPTYKPVTSPCHEICSVKMQREICSDCPFALAYSHE